MTRNSFILPQRDDQDLGVLLPSSGSLCKLEDERSGNLTQERFDQLLAWLNRDRDEAGRIYENIRSVLIVRFRSHHCSIPDKLADETIDRVARKLGEMVHPYVGDPLPYFYRVAYYVLLEYTRKEGAFEELPENLDAPAIVKDTDTEPEYECLDECMAILPSNSRA